VKHYGDIDNYVVVASRAIEGAHAPIQPTRIVEVLNDTAVVQNDVIVVPQLDVAGGAQVTLIRTW
jgi:hypothetical protein